MPTFVDTNVIVYTFDAEDQVKQAMALSIVDALVAEGEIVLSTQIVQELFVTLRRKFLVPLGPDKIDETVRRFSAGTVVQVDILMILAAMERVRTASISFWDGLVVEAALAAGSTRLLTEDLQHGQVFDGRLRVENPFWSAG